ARSAGAARRAEPVTARDRTTDRRACRAIAGSATHRAIRRTSRFGRRTSALVPARKDAAACAEGAERTAPRRQLARLAALHPLADRLSAAAAPHASAQLPR